MGIEYNPLTSFKLASNDPLTTPIFLGESGCAGIPRNDAIKYPIFKSQAARMFSAFWKKDEIKLTNDKRDYQALEPVEQGIWKDILRSQIVMDGVQSAALTPALLPLTTDPMVKRCLNYIEFFEELHTETYDHIVENVIPANEIYDGMKDMQYLVDRSKSIAKYYDDLMVASAKYRLGQLDKFSLKCYIWLCLQAINALEGLRFFISFAGSFAFGESGRMMGNASLISLIANDELLHVAFTTALLRILPNDDTDFARIKEKFTEESRNIFLQVIEEEKEVGRYLFRNGSILGLNEQLAIAYLEERANKCMHAIEMPIAFPERTGRSLPWMSKWLNDGDVQRAPQEQDLTSYVHVVKSDIDDNTFSEIEL